jgi:hypothetical protein
VILSDWLRQRTPTPPPELSARIQQTLGERCSADASAAPDLCIAGAEELLRELLTRPSAGRESALDLLTVDALVTYAFEAASDEPDSLAARAVEAMTRLAATAQE